MSEVKGVWTGRDTNRDEILFTVYEDGTATIAYRNLAARTWGPERTLEPGARSRQCVECGNPIRGMGVMVFTPDPDNRLTHMRVTDDLMCVGCGSNGRNIRPAPDG